MNTLTKRELQETAGGDDFDWTDFLGGMMYGADMVCVYTKNPYVCGGAMAAHGIFYFLEWY